MFLFLGLHEAQIPLNGRTVICRSTTPPSSVSSANLWKVHDVPASRTLMKVINSVCSGTEDNTSDSPGAGLHAADAALAAQLLGQFSTHLPVHLSSSCSVNKSMRILRETVLKALLRSR